MCERHSFGVSTCSVKIVSVIALWRDEGCVNPVKAWMGIVVAQNRSVSAILQSFWWVWSWNLAPLLVSYYLKGMQSFMGRDNLVVELLGIMSLFAVKCQQTTTKQEYFSNSAIILVSEELKRGYPLCLILLERHANFHGQRQSGCWVIGDHVLVCSEMSTNNHKTEVFQHFCNHFGEYGAETWLTSLSHIT